MSKASWLALAVVLAAIAGWVDAVGFLHFARLFLTFMSGNSTKPAVEIGKGEWSGVLAPVVAIAAFVFGSFLAALIAASVGAWRPPVVLATEAALLILSLALPQAGEDTVAAFIPVAIAMGAQNVALRQVGDVTVGLTYITGTLVKLGQSLAGAVSGTIAYGRIGYDALVVPAVASCVLAILMAARLLYQKQG